MYLVVRSFDSKEKDVEKPSFDIVHTSDWFQESLFCYLVESDCLYLQIVPVGL